MCRAVKCRACNKSTWAGCGAHVEQVLGHLPPEERCNCASTKAAATTSSGSWWQRVRGR